MKQPRSSTERVVVVIAVAGAVLAGCTSNHHSAGATASASVPATPPTSSEASSPSAAGSSAPSSVASSSGPSASSSSASSSAAASAAASSALATGVTPSASASRSPSPSASARPSSAPWPGYHANQARTGAVAADPSLDPTKNAWTASLGGVVHGQPVVADGRVIAATEENRVVALDPHTGKVLWSASLGKPLTNVDSIAGCGDIDPLGITSTPVVDASSNVVYVVGEISTGGSAVHHQLEGFNIATGAVVVSDDVDPPLPAGERAVNLLQRTSLALANGRIYIGYGGNDGDCGNYHGWLVAVNETGTPQLASFEVASDGQGGAIWGSGSAPAIDPAGDVYVSTGNANPDPPQGGPDPKKYTESVVKLSPALTVIASFKDTVAGGDEDLSTGNPVLLPDGNLFAVGKTDIGYVLAQSNLREIAAVKGICGSDPDGGPAYYAATNHIFVPCKDGGIQPVDLTTKTLSAKLAGANGAPILIGQDLWAAQYPSGELSEFNAVTGARLQTVRVGGTVSNFTTPSSALGLLLVGTDTGVTAFDGPGGLPPSP
jgi:polyvinyl alcohol dehydrogenase (cytochrome)